MDLLFVAQYCKAASGDMIIGGTPTWFEQSLNQTWSLTSLEDWLSSFAALYYSFLVQHWRANGNLTGSQWWSEATGPVVGTQLVLFGRLDLNPSQLILGCICVIAMIIASAISMLGVRIQQEPVRDGSVMDMISLLRGSSLPGIIAGDGDEDLGRDGRRHRAERTMVMYKNSTLDVPERLEDAHVLFDSEVHEMTGLKSSQQTITPPEQLEENLFINSGDRETTAVDLQNLMRTTTLLEQPEDEGLPMNSKDSGATALKHSLLTMTPPERLEENLIDSGDHEIIAVDLQNSMKTIALPELPEDEDLPINSEERGTTGLKRSPRTITRTSSGKSMPAG
ncbi:hypothetical protein BS47DRAFT_1397251 [Hydnum rufescens UP504]|uniref:Uncharacterized protein n=1 Tax=Hydnum rufescens UP504 TaxID=1448309 RepID=A0A9P6ANP1_9AGAM|nr:hypothetical protein BS47DRAFT_1397251 [Hydnum rufescens UP504]